jgi:putative addiction module killer protein
MIRNSRNLNFHEFFFGQDSPKPARKAASRQRIRLARGVLCCCTLLLRRQPVSYSLHAVSYGIQLLMFEVKRTDTFDRWLKRLKDSKGRTKIQARIDRLANGNPGDVGPIGEGLSELRIDFGPGYRVYYARTGKTLYLLLCGGDKGSQDADIKNAHTMWKELNPPVKKPAK